MAITYVGMVVLTRTNSLSRVHMAYHIQENSENEEITIVFHVDEALDEENKKRIEFQMLNVAGISGLELDRFRPHLLIISYSPSLIEAYKILRQIENLNLHAQLIVGI